MSKRNRKKKNKQLGAGGENRTVNTAGEAVVLENISKEEMVASEKGKIRELEGGRRLADERDGAEGEQEMIDGPVEKLAKTQRQAEIEIDGVKTEKKKRFQPWMWWLVGIIAVILVTTAGVAMWKTVGQRWLGGSDEVADETEGIEEAEGVQEGESGEEKPQEEEPKEEESKEEKPKEEEPKETEPPIPPIVERPEGEVTPPVVTPGSRVIALTFDDGPSGVTTPRLLDILQGRGVKVTFFVLGTMASANPGILQREAAEGHEVASHTPYHNQLTRLTYAQVRGEAVEMDRIFTDILGTVPPFTRPPYGDYNDTVRDALHQPLIIWSVDPRDWADRNSSIVCNRVVSAAHDGAIVLMHDIHATTVDAVPCIVDNLRAQGYEFLTVSELAAAKNIPLVNGGVYGRF